MKQSSVLIEEAAALKKENATQVWNSSWAIVNMGSVAVDQNKNCVQNTLKDFVVTVSRSAWQWKITLLIGSLVME